jgi:hypothetical protein
MAKPTWRPHLPPVDELVSTILSQNTSDTNRDMAFEALKLAFPTWQSVANAPPEEVVEAIRPAGLANQKGPRIQAALRQIEAEQGLMTLDFLRTMPLDEAQELAHEPQRGRPEDGRHRPALCAWTPCLSGGHSRPPGDPQVGPHRRRSIGRESP